MQGAPPGLLVERWQGVEVLGGETEWQVDLLSTDAALPFDSWLGASAQLLTRLADGADAVRSGIVRQSVRMGADGGLARYRLHLTGWPWLLTQGRHSRVFQERTVLEIVETVFADYAPMAAWRNSEELAAAVSQSGPRDYCVQYRESDADFVARLLAEDGIGWRLEEDADAPAGHVLVLFSDSSAQPQDAGSAAGGGVRFHRSDATEARDSIQAIGRRRRIGAQRLTLVSDDDQAARSISTQLPLDGGAPRALPLDAYDPVGIAAFRDNEDAARCAVRLAQAREAQQSSWIGQGTARSFRAGRWFALTGTAQAGADAPPELLLTQVRHAGINNLPVDLRSAVETYLGTGHADPSEPQALFERAKAVGYANTFEAVDRARPWRPVLQDDTGVRLNPRPTAPGYQTAIVVGAEGATTASGANEVHSDRMGRIRVRFHFQQGAQPDDRDSCWLRVAQRYAGPGVGSQFLPRIGQEVLVAFLDGDIDRPLVVGAVYNGRGEGGVPATPAGRTAEHDTSGYAQAHDQAPSAQVNLAGGHAPAWHGMGTGDAAHRNAAALWGIQSKEWGGAGCNRLVFDDSDGQLRLQLSTTQSASQLNLGHLIHQADNYRGSFRGEGFELRTDAWGAVRAESGLWLSAYGRTTAEPAGEAVPQGALLLQLATLGETFSKAATTHQTVKLASHEGVRQPRNSRLIDDQSPLQALLASAKTTVPGSDWSEATGAASERSAAAGADRVPHTGDALLGLAAPAGIGLIAGQSLTWTAGETLTLASGQASHLAVSGDLRVHSGQAIGMLAAAVEGQTEATSLSLVTGEGELDLQAQNDQIKLQAKDALQLVSANAELEMAAGKTLHLATAGGASLTIEGGNIVIACPGTIKVHAAKKSFVGPTQLSREMNAWPETKFNEGFELRDPAGDLIRNMPYKLTRADGAIIHGVTGENGRIPVQKGLGLERIVIEILQHTDGDLAG
ncbi:type VI secretion system Vgr family protein [Luteimonas terrae]|uniref:Type VI secretion system VgrG family protein n=1 Tax=Luteimonas terrae TaxID=1530191 RepID=A0ABU1XVJ9_9GAMM|nr:type VI secretion system tip protein TssI/VgrG [Luteimonas terrae]MDR7192628.1 type VI secretion system VgrG family protein [Luteimonas terrae]